VHQCNRCLCCLSLTTTATHSFRRMNEPRPGKNVNAWAPILGTRDPTKETA
jgi:hypothetical protein